MSEDHRPVQQLGIRSPASNLPYPQLNLKSGSCFPSPAALLPAAERPQIGPSAAVLLGEGCREAASPIHLPEEAIRETRHSTQSGAPFSSCKMWSSACTPSSFMAPLRDVPRPRIKLGETSWRHLRRVHIRPRLAPLVRNPTATSTCLRMLFCRKHPVSLGTSSEAA